MYTISGCAVSISPMSGRKTNLGASDPRIAKLEVIDWDVFALKALEAVQGLIKDVPGIGGFIDGIMNNIYPALNTIVIKGLEAEIKKSLEIAPDQPLNTGTLSLFLSDGLGDFLVSQEIFGQEMEVTDFSQTFTYEFIMSKKGPVWVILFGDKAMGVTGKVTEVILNIINKVMEEITGIEAEVPPDQEDPAVQAWLASIQTKMNEIVNALPYFSLAEVDTKFNELWPTIDVFMTSNKPAIIDTFKLLSYKTTAKNQLKAALDSKAKTGSGATNMRMAVMAADWKKIQIAQISKDKALLPLVAIKRESTSTMLPLAIGGVALFFLLRK